MNFTFVKKHQRLLIIGLVVFFALFALWLRLIPMLTTGTTDILSKVASDDPQYDLRLVELSLANHFQYAWFDPMTNFPVGTSIYWGPLTIYIADIACTVAGAVTRPEIIGVSLLITPLFAAATVVLMYFVGKAFGDWKTGLLASGFTAVVSGTFFLYSLYGYFNHRDGEVLFSTLFVLAYLYILIKEKGTKIDLADFSTWKKIAFLSVLAGIAYLLGLFTMPTMILFAFIVGVFTLVQFMFDFCRGRSSEYLLIANTIIFSIAIIGFLIFGFKGPGMDLSTYSVGHVYAYVCLIAATSFLYLLARYLKGRVKYCYPLIIGSIGILFVGILFAAAPQLYTLFVNDLVAFFGQAPVTQTVMDAMAWSPDEAWTTFNFGLVLMAGGILVTLYNNLKEERPQEVFALIWALVIFFSTWQHVRYEYYLAVVVALLSAVCIHFIFERGWGDIYHLATRIMSHDATAGVDVQRDDTHRGKKQKKKSPGASTKLNYLLLALVVVASGLGVLFAYTSAATNYQIGSSNVNQMNPDWEESLQWLGNNTPDTGVNYLTIYDPKTFQYPSTAYGVMSWWDYGHMITYIAKRIPNANPFQEGVTGPDGAAAYFMATSEDTANAALDQDRTRYVITDIEMDTGKFYAMSTWFNASAGTGPYQMNVLVPQGATDENYQIATLNKQPYYLTMISRLQNFDGSLAQPDGVYYVEYADPEVTHESIPVVMNAQQSNLSAATLAAEQYNQNAQAGYHAAVLGLSPVQPVDTVPALQHYRLIHESPTNALGSGSDSSDVKYVKIFEYVKGAHIKGTGIIDIPLVTNQGRNFTYRQESVNGEFVVPYSTTGNLYPVQATGPYQIEGTSTTFEVPESAVMQGTTIN